MMDRRITTDHIWALILRLLFLILMFSIFVKRISRHRREAIANIIFKMRERLIPLKYCSLLWAGLATVSRAES